MSSTAPRPLGDDPLQPVVPATQVSASGDPATLLEFRADTPGYVPSATAGVDVPGYEVLGVLGRGGMGIVYKARQLRADRLVALKMILSGIHASTQEHQRFQVEARAVARLSHPNIIQVYDVGEWQAACGQPPVPYFSLEFCPGGSLDKKLAGVPLPPRVAAELVEMLARAMDAAHQAQIVHRDLKPANVLLAEDGSPRITDFGLAKRLDEAAQTQSGAVLGTPSYMAPEQAQGKGKEVGPACDIYALGAILYECLTGRPPFRAATAVDTLLQVVHDEPVPPTQLNPGVPRDLETICLKCLQKVPEKRYPGATALGEELGRFLRGEPIMARPVGRLERAFKWIRRNPLTTGLAAAVALALLLGTVISFSFAVEARSEATAAREAGKLLVQANDDLLLSEKSLEESLARSLLRPLGGKDSGAIADPEVEALWELSHHRGERLWRRFLEEALASPGAARQLRNRAEFALHSALGLDAGRRAQAEELLWANGLKESQRADTAVALAALGGLRPAEAREAAQWLNAAVARERDFTALEPLAQALASVSVDLPAAEAVAALTPALARETTASTRPVLVQALARAASRLTPTEAAVAAHALTQAIVKHTNAYARGALAEALALVSARLPPADGARLCGEVAAALSQSLSGQSSAHIRLALAQALAAVANRLTLADAGRHCGAAAALLSQALVKEMEFLDHQQLSEALRGLSGCLTPRDAAAISTTLHQALARETNYDARKGLAKALAAMGTRLDPGDAAAALAGVSTLLSRETNGYARVALAEAVTSIAARMEPVDAAAAHVRAIAGARDALVRRALAQGLLSVSPQLVPGEGIRHCREAASVLARALSRETSLFPRRTLAEALSTVTAGLEPGEAAATLAQALNTEKAPLVILPLADGLAAAAARLKRQEANRCCAPVAALLSGALSWVTTADGRKAVALALASVTAHLDSGDAARFSAEAAGALAPALARESTVFAMTALAKALASATDRLEPEVAARYRAEAAADLFLALARQTAPAARQAVIEALTLLDPPGKAQSPRLSPQQLVNLLKHPLCVREARRVVLDQLQVHYRRPFADQWEFVRFAVSAELDLDLRSSPPRPASGTRTVK